MLIFFSFARRISSKVISLTCEIEPGAAVILSLYSVCMLSITRNLYSRSARLAKIAPRFISVNKKSSRSFAPSLSALSLIWLALSSPLTYRVGAFLARLLATFKSKVLLPIPGLPPISTSEPSTSPPPRTRSSSLSPVLVRASSVISTSVIGVAFALADLLNFAISSRLFI